VRIDRIRIEGFGQFHDCEFGPLDQSVSVFLGSNEAGKSTLLQFIRTVFFGFRSRPKDEWYPPLQGGRHGGHISIVDERGERFEISRFIGRGFGPVQVRGNDGGVHAESLLGELLGGHGHDVFTNLFAFTLTELQTAGVLENEDVNRQIYSAGVGERNLPEAARRLGQARRKLFLPGGRKHRLAAIQRQILELEDRLRESKGQSRRHGEVVAELAELAAAKEDLRAQIAAATARIDRAQRLKAARGDFEEFEAAQDRLAQLPQIEGFPESAIARLDAAQDRLGSARSERERSKRALERARQALPALPGGGHMDVDDVGVRRLVVGRSEFDSSVRSLPQREVELVRSQAAFDSAAAELGEDWPAEKIEEFAITAQTRSQIAEFGLRLAQAASELADERAARRQTMVQLDSAREYQGSAGSRSFSAAGNPTRLVAATVAGIAIAAILIGALAARGAPPQLVFGAAAAGFGIAMLGTAVYLARSVLRTGEATAEVNRLEAALRAGEQRERRAESALEAERGAWREWLEAAGLHTSFSPDQLHELRAFAAGARATLENLESTRHRIRAIRRDINDYAAIVKALADQAGLPCQVEDSASVAAAADGLIELVERTRSSQTAFADAGRELADREQALAGLQGELADLLATGGADDAEHFRQRARTWDQRLSLDSQAQQALTRLKRHCGGDQTINDLCRQLADPDPAMHANADQAQNDLEDLNAALQSNARREGELLSELRGFESDEESDRLVQQRDVLLGQLSQAAHQWKVVTLAEHLLAEARRRYENERKPAIIRTAQEVFANLTAGRYRQIVAPLGSDTIEVVEEGKSRKRPENLSRGTREQLFLALRFGLIRELNQQAPRLPVAVDEVLVNFDPGRAMRAATELVKLARTNQLLVFTCHPPTVEIFAKAALEIGEPKPAVISLDQARYSDRLSESG
jgi:uncharacterized protein YhaN